MPPILRPIIARRALPVLAAALLLGAASASATAAGANRPRAGDLLCLAQCAGPRKAAVGGEVRIQGHHLGHITEVAFHGTSGPVTTIPEAVATRHVVVEVPAGAVSGRLRVSTSGGDDDTTNEALHVVDASELPTHLRLRSASVRPHRAYFDGRPEMRARYRFNAANPTDVTVEVVRASDGNVVRRWQLPDQHPFAKHSRSWNGLEEDGDVADDGRYRFKVGEQGEKLHGAGSLVFHGYRFPVRGPHGYGGYLQSFGAPRSGGRTHQGQDVYAACGTSLQAARGGRIQAKAYDPSLYGNFIVIDGRKTSADYMYAHMVSPSPLGKGARVHTGQGVGRVGKTGNARTTPCHLHFEIWPHGWRNGSPIDPKPSLRRWDNWS